jgi:hypothetical protein
LRVSLTILCRDFSRCHESWSILLLAWPRFWPQGAPLA